MRRAQSRLGGAGTTQLRARWGGSRGEGPPRLPGWGRDPCGSRGEGPPRLPAPITAGEEARSFPWAPLNRQPAACLSAGFGYGVPRHVSRGAGSTATPVRSRERSPLRPGAASACRYWKTRGPQPAPRLGVAFQHPASPDGFPPERGRSRSRVSCCPCLPAP